ncbi:C-GCAxxG-C-C family protein [Acetanaerobacterium elongatum]|uniref:C_GCAxxG_C_C family probable redox protein n=1 Tax=Acetanaerobacterium elongatum TaxID=258515 RepID=A0A1H0F232_9FIRM|nr:C-GCAxxG-C-C family protein [Acetanaerobacterium elongatum]SDN88718.1 C_GCAxxG_C_C family probable redox protein [Acetanaerobacterium elongatum]
MDRTAVALQVFDNKFNCAQAVFSAFAEDLGLDKETAYKVAGCFGGGMRCGEVCGAVSGALMALGCKYGQTLPGDTAAKELASKKAVEFIELFKARNGSILCKELLGYNLSLPEEMKILKDKNLFATVCPRVITDAVKIAGDVL